MSPQREVTVILGHLAQPFLTITYAISQITDDVGGYTIYCRAGTYNERVRIWEKDGIDGSPNVLRPYNTEDVVIDGTGIAIPAGSGLIYCDSDYWEFYDLEVQDVALEGTSEAGTGIWVDATENKVSYCFVHDCWAGGIRSTGDHTTIEYNYIKDVCLSNADWTEQDGEYWSQGINTRSSQYDTIRHNRLRNIAGEGLSATRTLRATIEDNIIHNAASAHLYIMNSEDPLVQRNFILNDTLAGDNIVATGIAHYNEGTEEYVNERAIIINNVVSGCGRNLYSACKLYGTVISNNVFVNGRSNTLANVQLNSYLEDTGAEFRNNIIIQDNTRACIQSYISTGATVNWTFSNNLYSKAYSTACVGADDIISTISIVGGSSNEWQIQDVDYYRLLYHHLLLMLLWL